MGSSSTETPRPQPTTLAESHALRGALLAIIVISLTGSLATAAPEPRPAPQTAPNLDRIVALKDGSIFRGEVVELIPGEYVVVRLRRGLEKRFSWWQIESLTIPVRSVTEVRASLQAEAEEGPKPTALVPQQPTGPTSANGAAMVRAATSPPKPRPPWLDENDGNWSAPAKQDRAQPVLGPTRPGPEKNDNVAVPPASYPVGSKQPSDSPPKVANPPGHSIDLPPQHDLLLTGLPPALRPYAAEFVNVKMVAPADDLQLEYMTDKADAVDFGSYWPRSTDSWRVACKYPCEERVHRDAVFRVTSPGLSPSAEFSLPKRAAYVRLGVTSGSRRARQAGITLAVLGGVSITVGLAFITLQDVEQANHPGQQPVGGPLWTYGGVALLAPGLAAAAVGIGLSVSSGIDVSISSPPRPQTEGL